MRSLVITPRNDDEFRFISALLDKLGIGSSSISKKELEDIGLSKLMQEVDKNKKASREEIVSKLSAS